ncbi:MAG: serine/threonine-protein kinase, partial [Planctomycetota bacterium]
MDQRPADILGEALELPEDRRSAFVQSACGADDSLRAEVESLLRAYAEAGEFLDLPDNDETSAHAAVGEQVGTVIGHYKLLQKIGEGGFGTVYMAEQFEPVRRRVALKIVKPGMDTRQVLARFEAERQALAMMDHPNIARVLDGGATENGRPFFVMELVRGVPITEFCDKNKLSTRERLEIMIDVAVAVQHAHQKGVIHRDLKPTNVLVTVHDGRPVPKVIDFGIAKAISSPLTDKTLFTEFRQMVGTPQYMSPEQAEMSGIDIDTRTDIYSLGVLLYELLTGTPPLPARELRQAGLVEMQRVIREVEPPRPSMRLSTMGDELELIARSRSVEPSNLSRVMRGDLDWIVMTALDKDRQRRYPSANDFASDLQRYLDDQPVTAVPPSAMYRMRKLVRRNRVAVTAASIVITALLTSVILATTFAIYAGQSLDRARDSERVAKVQQGKAIAAAALAESRAEENSRLLYAMSVRAAEVAIQNGNLNEARRILDACDPAERGLEWSWLDNIAQDRGRTLGEHAADGIRDIEYSPDGHFLTSTGQDGVARVWDLHAETLLHELRGHAGVVTGASFSPDGTRLATCGADATVRIWDLSSGRELAVLTGHTSWLSSIAYDPSGQWIVSAGGNSNLRLWNAETFELEREFGGYTHDVWSVEFSPDGQRIATCSGDGWIVVWDVKSSSQSWSR